MTSKDYIIVTIVISLLVAIGANALFNQNQAASYQEEIDDISKTVILTYEKAEREGNTRGYSLEKYFKNNPGDYGYYNMMKKEFKRKLFNLRVFNVFVGPSVVDDNYDSFSDFPSEDSIFLFFALNGHSQAEFTNNCQDLAGDYDVSLDGMMGPEANPDRDIIPDYCFGGEIRSGDYMIIITGSEAIASKINSKYLDNEGELIDIAGEGKIGIKLKMR